MTNFNRVLYIMLFSLLGSQLQADPIQDLSFNDYQAGWYPNFINQQGPMNCSRTCSAWLGVEREHEQSNNLDPNTKETSVCKITRDRSIIIEPKNDPGAHWLYGNQFDGDSTCIFTDSSGKADKSEYFMCLCVDRCEKPDLIVSAIFRPAWDNANRISRVRAEITNIGSALAPLSTARMTDTVTLASDLAVTPALAPGASAIIEFTFSYWVYDPNAELSAAADFNNTIDECDESNNTQDFFGLG